MTFELKQSTLDFLEKGGEEIRAYFEKSVKQSRYALEAPHAGINTLAKADLSGSLDGVDIALLGVPTDIGLTNRPGARLGPNALREMAQINTINTSTGVKPFDMATIRDVGNVRFERQFNLDHVAQDIYTHFLQYPEAGSIPIAVGGDHSITFPILKALAPSEPVGVIHVDAHHDTVAPYGGSKFHHGAPFLLGVLENHIDPARMVQIGIRDPFVELNSFARESGMTVIDMDTLRNIGIDNAVAKARDVVGDGPVYLTFDVDGLDPAYMPGTGTPVPGGLTMREALAMLRGLRGLNFIGADLVEVSPPLESGDTTALNAAYIYFEILCLVAEARHAQR